MLGLPFGKAPYTKWEKKLEKKPRMELDFASSSEDDDDNASIYSSSSSSSDKTSSIDSDEARQRHIRNLLPSTPEDGRPPKKKIYFQDDFNDDIVPTPSITSWIWKGILGWRERERARRMHYIVKEYEARVIAHDEMLKKKMADEMAAQERAVKLEAYRSKQRIARSLKKVLLYTYIPKV